MDLIRWLRESFCRLFWVGLVTAFAAGCSNGVEHNSDALAPITDVWSEPDWQARYDWGQEPLVEVCQTATNQLLHHTSWPGLGVSLLVRVFDDEGSPRAEIPEDWFQFASLWGVPIPVAQSPATIEREYLSVLLTTPDSLDAITGEDLADFIEAQPVSSDVALFLACGAAVQAAGFGTGRALLRQLLTDGELACDDNAAGNLWEVLNSVVLETERIGGGALPALRSVVVVDGDLTTPPEPLPFGGSPVVIQWLTEGPAETEFPIVAQTALSEVSADLATNRQGLHSLGACTGLKPDEPVTLTTTEGASWPFVLPEGPGELEEMDCNAEAIAALQHDFPGTVEFLFSPQEREIYDGKVSDKDQKDFTLQVRLGDAPPVAATAHLRGQTSLDCARKSYTVNLKGDHGRHILPGSATDEFYLISMCKDDRYFQQYLANVLAAPQGLFPLQFGLVELFVEGETKGVYLLLEKTKEALLEDHSRVYSVIRRRFDPGETSPDLLHPATGTIDGPAGAAYFALAEIGGSFTGEALLTEMNRHMDFDQFLRILAFQTLLGNGDYVDEVIFYSTEAVRSGGKREWFQAMAWDMDDLFSACHHSGKHAIVDPHEILYCAEGNIEKAVMGDPLVYARFVGLLEELMSEQITEAAVDAGLEQTAAALLPFFDDPAICAAMTVLVERNPEAIDPAVARADIQAHMDTLRGQYAARRDKLATRIKAYHEAEGN